MLCQRPHPGRAAAGAKPAACSAPRAAARRRCRPHSHQGRYRFDGQTRGGRYSWARYYHPGLQRFISEDPVGAGDGENLYLYVGGNPLTRVDPFGLYWEYSQHLGMLTHVDEATGIRTAEGWGYSGHGSGLNNPAYQYVPGNPLNPDTNAGPLPQGMYTIGPIQDISANYDPSKVFRNSMKLTPDPSNVMHGRGGFLIHGSNDYSVQKSSQGCVIVPPTVRYAIGASPDKKFKVVP